MKLLAYPTATNILHTIGEAPSHRPLARTGCYKFEAQPNDPTPQSKVYKKAYNSRGFTGSRADKFIQNNQFLPVSRAPGVYPLSTPGVEGLGNVGDSAPQPRPGFDAPMNGDFQSILNILNSKDNDFTGKSLSSGQVRLLAERREKLTRKPEAGDSGAVQVATDFADTRKVMMKEQRIRNAEAQGFTRQEAEKAYAKLRDREAETALSTQESVSSRFADLIDSRLGGTQDGSVRNNDESALHLAQNLRISPHKTVKEMVMANRSRLLAQIPEGTFLRRTVPFVNNPLLQDTTTGRGILPPSQLQTPRPTISTGMFLRGGEPSAEPPRAASSFRRNPFARRPMIGYDGQPVVMRRTPSAAAVANAAAVSAMTAEAEAVREAVSRRRGERGPDRAPRVRRTAAQIAADRASAGAGAL
jgi:hypothetical protein